MTLKNLHRMKSAAKRAYRSRVRRDALRASLSASDAERARAVQRYERMMTFAFAPIACC